LSTTNAFFRKKDSHMPTFSGSGTRYGQTLLILLLFLFYPLCSSAEQQPPISFSWELVRLTTPVSTASPTDDTRIEVKGLAILWLEPEQGWHAYSNQPGGTGMPTRVAATLEPGETPLQSLYLPGKATRDVFEPDKTVNIYKGRTPIFIPLKSIPEPGTSIRASIGLLLCSATSCWPVNTTETLSRENVPSPLSRAEDRPWWPQAARTLDIDSPSLSLDKVEFSPSSFSPGLEVRTTAKAALFAFLAGLILNFMPCVLPVITLKLRSFIPAVGTDGQAQATLFRTHNLFFALGMILYFLVLAVIIGFTGMAWGEIFQKPGAVLTLTVIVFALSLSLFGLYDLPIIDLKAGHNAAKGHPRLESLFTGVLATVLATPCSGPFLGGVLAWALIQPPVIIATVLACIGLGMASPYLLMAAFPSLFRFLPRPGDWTVTLERLLGFLLLGTCVYLFALLPSELHIKTLVLFWAVGLGAWTWGKWTTLRQTAPLRWGIRGAILGGIALTVLVLFSSGSVQDPWTDFSKSRFEEMAGSRNMVVEFTADWCPNCKFLEKTVLTPKLMVDLQEKYDLALLRVDLTRKNPDGSDLLKRLGSRSIPVLAVFSAEKPKHPLILRDLFTRKQLRQALAQALGE
jgi:thiol:disulfide interchange protein DsbD